MALVSTGTQTWLKPRRIEGHTSNVEVPIQYITYGTVVPANVTAGDSFVLAHKIPQVTHINLTPTTAGGATALYGAASGAATLGAHVAVANAIPWETVGASAIAGATTLTLGSGSSAVADVYNGATIDIRLSNGNIQTTTISDYAVTTKIATLTDALVGAVAAAGEYRVRGSIVTCPTAGSTLGFLAEVVGQFDTN